MTDETVPAPVTHLPIPKVRIDLANNALFEITEISRFLREYIATRDTCGDVQYVARGALARVQKLSEAITECLEAKDAERWPDTEIAEVIECRKVPAAQPTSAEAGQ